MSWREKTKLIWSENQRDVQAAPAPRHPREPEGPAQLVRRSDQTGLPLTFRPNGCPGLFSRTFWFLPVFLSAERMVLLLVSDQKTLSLKTATEKGLGVSASWRI